MRMIIRSLTTKPRQRQPKAIELGLDGCSVDLESLDRLATEVEEEWLVALRAAADGGVAVVGGLASDEVEKDFVRDIADARRTRGRLSLSQDVPCRGLTGKGCDL